MAGVLGLGPEDYLILGLALAEYAAGTPRDTRDGDRREQAEHLRADLVRWGLIPGEPPTVPEDVPAPTDRDGGATRDDVGLTHDNEPPNNDDDRKARSWLT